jgi:hypothetical protein
MTGNASVRMTADSAAEPPRRRRLVRGIALALSMVWGFLLAMLLLGFALEGSVIAIVYAGSALVVWIVGFAFALRSFRGNGFRATRWALTAIAASMLGPLGLFALFLGDPRTRVRLPPRALPVALVLFAATWVVFLFAYGFYLAPVALGNGSDTGSVARLGAVISGFAVIGTVIGAGGAWRARYGQLCTQRQVVGGLAIIAASGAPAVAYCVYLFATAGPIGR